VVSVAWRNVVAAAYPDARVRWRTIFASYVAGTGVNAIIPARGGDVVRLAIAKRRVEGSTYPTLGATIVLLTLFDMLVAGCLIIWGSAVGVLPSFDVLPDLPSFDFGWFFRHPQAAQAIIGGGLVVLFGFSIWAARKVQHFWERVRQGFAILGDRPRYLRGVVAWQLLDWCLRVTTIYFFLRAFGLPATVHNALLVQVCQSLSTVLPFSPGGIGTEQAFVVYVLRGTATRTALLSFSVGMRVTLTVVNVVVGFAAILLTLRTLRWRRAVEPEPEPDYSTGSPR
jgi:glycosyltransferase 2 family protein